MQKVKEKQAADELAALKTVIEQIKNILGDSNLLTLP
jgi:septation ring formation regulator EzrA